MMTRVEAKNGTSGRHQTKLQGKQSSTQAFKTIKYKDLWTKPQIIDIDNIELTERKGLTGFLATLIFSRKGCQILKESGLAMVGIFLGLILQFRIKNSLF